MKESWNEMDLESQGFRASMCFACKTDSWKLGKNSLLLAFQAKWNYSLLIVSLSSLQAGIWWHRLSEGPWGQPGALLEISAAQSSCKIPFAGKSSAGWTVVKNELRTEGWCWKHGWEICWLFSQQHPLNRSFMMSLEEFACASLSHPILYSIKEEAKNWMSLYLPFHLHKQPPWRSIWRHALDEARLIAQKLCLFSSSVNISFPVGWNTRCYNLKRKT